MAPLASETLKSHKLVCGDGRERVFHTILQFLIPVSHQWQELIVLS